jgi:predicted amidohydrolase YtcJ
LNPEEADIVLLNANVITMDADDTRAEGVAVEDGKIVAVGSRERISKSIGRKTTVIDLGQRTLLPGFIDAHTHLTGTAIASCSLDLQSAKSVREILEKLRSYAYNVPKDQVIFGIRVDETRYPEKRCPTRPELDEVVPDRYVLILHETGHAAVVNTKTLSYLNLRSGEPGVDVDSESGRPTGLLGDPVVFPARGKLIGLMSDEDLKRAVKMAAEGAVRMGLTTIHTMGELGLKQRGVRIMEEMIHQLPVRVLAYLEASGDTDDDICRFPTKSGLKVFADGAIENHTAALFEPYSDDPSTKGMLCYTEESMNDLVLKSHKAGIQLAIHCESDAAIEQALNAYENALKIHPKEDHRHRIEHYELSTEAQNRRAARLGVALSMQPVFMHLFGGPRGRYAHYLGEERMKRAHTYKSLRELGILIAGGSDSPVTPWNPILGIHALVNHPNVGQRLSVREALQIFTINGAKIAFEEDKKGTIEAGKFADFVVLSKDPFAVNPDEIKDIGVLMTVVGGEVVYQRHLE